MSLRYIAKYHSKKSHIVKMALKCSYVTHWYSYWFITLAVKCVCVCFVVLLAHAFSLNGGLQCVFHVMFLSNTACGVWWSADHAVATGEGHALRGQRLKEKACRWLGQTFRYCILVSAGFAHWSALEVWLTSKTYQWEEQIKTNVM